jgi:carbon monoxide dehydrogenase subunit G
VQIENDFVVNAPVDQVWNYLLDVEKIAPCAPGAELTEVVDDRTWKGKMNVKVGPVAMSFAGTVTLQDRDDAARRAVLKAEGREQRGRGAASALVSASLEEVAGGTKVSITTDLTISGAAAQYGRGMIGDVSKRLTGQFASCLQTNMVAQEASRRTEESTGEEQAAQPVKGFRLALWALWRAIVRAIRRLFARRA